MTSTTKQNQNMIAYYNITAENLTEARDACPAVDQSSALCIGAETWGIQYQPGNQRGQMLRLPDGRGAACFGGDSTWGDWSGDVLILDSGEKITESGEVLA